LGGEKGFGTHLPKTAEEYGGEKKRGTYAASSSFETGEKMRDGTKRCRKKMPKGGKRARPSYDFAGRKKGGPISFSQ